MAEVVPGGPEDQPTAQTYGENKCRTFQLGEVKKQIQSKLAEFLPMPPTSIVENQTNAKRPTGIFGNWTPCVLVQTKDRFLHVLDREFDEKPVFSFNLKKTVVRVSDKDKSAVEVEELRRKMSILERIYGSNVCSLQFVDAKTAGEWVEKIGRAIS